MMMTMMMTTTRTTMSAVVLLILNLVTITLGQGFQAVSYTLPSPPVLFGPLEPNYALYNAERLHANKVMGPTSFAFQNGNVYAVTADRKVVNLATCGASNSPVPGSPQVVASLSAPGCRGLAQCGLLTSIRVDNTGMLLVLDAYRGLFRIDPSTGRIQQLYSTTTPVNGRTPKYLNGMVQIPDGTILLSDSSDRFDAVNDIYILMEGRTSGRILALNPTNLKVMEVKKDGFAYPNGLEVSADGSKLLVAETGRARIMSVSLAQQNLLQTTVFSDNLPGVPTNIRRSSRGTYWVGLAKVRHAGIPNSMDYYSNNPAARTQTVYRQTKETIDSYYPKYGLLVELDANGKIIGSLHDPTGQVFSGVSEGAEVEGLLYVGSTSNAFAGRIVLPQGDGRVVTIDSVIQVLRSRCQIREENLAQAKKVLQELLHRQSGGASGTTTAVTTPAPTAAIGTGAGATGGGGIPGATNPGTSPDSGLSALFG